MHSTNLNLDSLKERIFSQLKLFFDERDPSIKEELKQTIFEEITIYYVMELYSRSTELFPDIEENKKKKKNNWLKDY